MSETWVNYILKIGAIATASTAVGRILVGVYKKLVTDPYNNTIQTVQDANTRQITESLTPLTMGIERLNYLLEDSKRDREVLHSRNDEQDCKIGDHEIRITVLEDRGSGKR